MLNYGVRYDITCGIFHAFTRGVDKRLLHVKHKQNKRDSMQQFFHTKYETFTRENYIVTCLYIMIKYSPSGIHKMLSLLDDVNQEDVIIFKNKILQYSSYLTQDIMYLREKYGLPSINVLMTEYKKGSIQFYTLWFLYKKLNVDIEDYILNNKINGKYLKNIRTMLLYVTFKQSTIDKIGVLLEESNLMKGF